jgi:ATP-dependent Lon protease
MKKSNKIDNLSLKNILAEKKVNDLSEFIKEKTAYVQNIIRDTIISINANKKYDIFSNNDINFSLQILNELYEKTTQIERSIEKNEDNIEILQKTIDKLSMVICGFGTKNIDDLLFISFGSEYVNIKIMNSFIKDKYELIRKYIQPTGYKLIHWKPGTAPYSSEIALCSNKSSQHALLFENAQMFECFDIENPSKSFYQKINGIRVIIQNPKAKKTLIINGIINDIQMECFSNSYINKRIEELKKRAETLIGKEKDIFKKVIDTLTFKEILTLGDEDVYKKTTNVLTESNIIKMNKLNITIERFLELDAYNQRNLLVHLLINDTDPELQYICYLLYDLISIQSIDGGDKNEQLTIYDSFPWKIKEYFKDVIKFTVKYTNDMSQKYDINKISLEQQVYLLKVDDNVKEKAMAKLKEVKTKSDEMGIKAKQYLEGLIKIPFGIYKEEPVLKKMKEMNANFSKILIGFSEMLPTLPKDKKSHYANVEMFNIIKTQNEKIIERCSSKIRDVISGNKSAGVNLKLLNNVLNFNKPNKLNLRSRDKRMVEINNFLRVAKTNEITNLYDFLKITPNISLTKLINDANDLQNKIANIEEEMNKITQTLDDSIHGHSHAKNQILKIIAQWMNGEQSGYSFGFEGSPGIGKTSLAKKGLANCLKDENGTSRPYSFIALGGSSNGKTLEGHGYTYVHSNWGKIVDILIDSKCMNPIIYIDELDKVSKTEEGKEIIGILIHLIDQTQNDVFQDKYFNGINLDLSKALFIFSYNDPEQIDKILLDRIHRIKFDNLTLEEKITITNKYIIPEMNIKMGFDNTVQIDDEIIKHMIETYTCEPGVRKLKELIFDLFGEINIEILKSGTNNDLTLPIILTKELLRNKYLKNYKVIKHNKIHKSSRVGIINGLWANAAGMGGILPIETMFYPSETFLELKLTGLQGEVMKESMNVAKTLAWSLTDNEIKKKWIKQFNETKCQGLHVHCPEGGVSKDGPSAGAAITALMYSLFNDKKIKNNIALTGEIDLQGNVLAIGGIREKLLGGIKSGILVFLYPHDNEKEFNDFYDYYKERDDGKIQFKAVKTISEIFDSVFEE